MRKNVMFIGLLLTISIAINAQNVGVGTTSPTQKLDVAGNLRVSGAIMPGGTAGTAGQVLRSNGDNQPPTWEEFSLSGGGKVFIPFTVNSNVAGRQGYSQSSGGAVQEDSVDFAATRYNIGTDFSVTSSGFLNGHLLINRTGLYKITGQVGFVITHASSGLTPTSSVAMLYTTPGVGNFSLNVAASQVMAQSTTVIPFFYTNEINFSYDLYFVAGTTICFRASFGNLLNYPYNSISVKGGFLLVNRISD